MNIQFDFDSDVLKYENTFQFRKALTIENLIICIMIFFRKFLKSLVFYSIILSHSNYFIKLNAIERCHDNKRIQIYLNIN